MAYGREIEGIRTTGRPDIQSASAGCVDGTMGRHRRSDEIGEGMGMVGVLRLYFNELHVHEWDGVQFSRLNV